MAERTSTRDYSTQVANLQGTGTGASFANRLNGTTHLLADLNDCDEGAADTLTASARAGLVLRQRGLWREGQDHRP
jgi:hypothetical protein